MGDRVLEARPQSPILRRPTPRWGDNGHVIEGIFRVSPATSQLKASRQLFESGKHKEIRDMESVAHLVKLWRRARSKVPPCCKCLVESAWLHVSGCMCLVGSA